MIPQIVQRLIVGYGALTLDLARAKQEIIAVTAHSIVEENNSQASRFLRLDSNILELTNWDITKNVDRIEVRTFVITLLNDLGFPATFFDQVFIVTDEGGSVTDLNQNSIRCIAHILNTVAKHITKPYSKRVKYSDDEKKYAKEFDDLISDVKKLIGKAR